MTALVFDRLSSDARRLAVQASQKYLGNKDEAPGYVGVFGIDLALTPYAPFTRNARVLRQALSKMDSRASSTFNNAGQNERKSSLDAQAASAGQAAAAAESAGGAGAGAAVGGAPGDAMLAQMASGMIRDFEVMERDQQGYSTTNGLFTIINTLRPLPGRKSLVLFSEGIAIPPAVQRLFLGVDRRRQPRQRQHLRHGRRRSARRKRTGENPRPGERGGRSGRWPAQRERERRAAIEVAREE